MSASSSSTKILNRVAVFCAFTFLLTTMSNHIICDRFVNEVTKSYCSTITFSVRSLALIALLVIGLQCCCYSLLSFVTRNDEDLESGRPNEDDDELTNLDSADDLPPGYNIALLESKRVSTTTGTTASVEDDDDTQSTETAPPTYEVALARSQTAAASQPAPLTGQQTSS